MKEGDDMPIDNHGELRVKKISATKVAVALFVIKGYDYGDFVDTLQVKNNRAAYTRSRIDCSCRIDFTFSGSTISVKQTSKVHPSPCGFGWNADISGVYRKVSAKAPVITDLTKE